MLQIETLYNFNLFEKENDRNLKTMGSLWLMQLKKTLGLVTMKNVM